jgi:hypothetical protein
VPSSDCAAALGSSVGRSSGKTSKRGIHGDTSARGAPVRVVRLPVQHHAGQGAGDAVQYLHAKDDQPAELIQTGRLHSGDDVLGASEVLSQLHTIKVSPHRLGDMGDLADLALDEHMGAQHAVPDPSSSDRAVPA